jgi:hypothetical protein
MKVLAVPILTPTNRQPGLVSALEKLAGGDDFQVFDWIPYFICEKLHALRRDFRAAVQKFQPQFTFLQIQTPGILTSSDLQAIPGFRLQWTGDIRRPFPAHYIETGQHCDVSCFACDEDAAMVRKEKVNAEYLGIGFDPATYFPKELPQRNPQIVFLGNNYRGDIFPLSNERREMVRRLKSIHGDNFQAYGHHWEGSKITTEEQEVDLYRRCKIAINQNHFGQLTRWSSDRLLRAMGCGAFMLSNYYKGIEKDFEIGKHLDVWQTLPELEKKIDYYLGHEDKRAAIAKAGCQHVHKNHSWDNRMEEIKKLITKYHK